MLKVAIIRRLLINKFSSTLHDRFWPIAVCQLALDCPSLGLPAAILTWHRRGLAGTRTLELGQALFDVAGVFTNRLQSATDIIPNL